MVTQIQRQDAAKQRAPNNSDFRLWQILLQKWVEASPEG